jgi:hypothetical protein
VSYAEGYVDVAARIAEFYAKHPDGSLQMDPPEWVEVEGQRFIMARAYAYRSPDDVRPGIGSAWEAVPGRTPYTRGSELMNLETSCWGRAIAALGIATRQGVATAQEVEAAKERQSFPPPAPPKNGAWRDQPVNEKGMTMIQAASRKRGLTELDWVGIAERLGWEFPQAGLAGLTGGQAKDLLDVIDKGYEVKNG